MLEGLFRAPAIVAVRVLFDVAGAAEFPAAVGTVGAAVAAAGVVAAAAFAALLQNLLLLLLLEPLLLLVLGQQLCNHSGYFFHYVFLEI